MAASDIRASDTRSSTPGPRPAEIAGQKFPQAKKGYDPEQVQRFLKSIGEYVARLESEIQRQRARVELLERRSASAQEAAYARVSRHITGVMRAADEAAMKIRAEATADAESTVSDGRDEAERIALAATEEAERALESARTDAREELARAREEVGSILAEAKAEAERLVANARDEGARLLRKATSEVELAQDLAAEAGRIRGLTVHPSASAERTATADPPAIEPAIDERRESLDETDDDLQRLSASIWDEPGPARAEQPDPSPWPAEEPAPSPWPLQEPAPVDEAQAILPTMDDDAPGEPDEQAPSKDVRDEIWGSNGHAELSDDFFSMEGLDLNLEVPFLDLFDDPEKDEP